MLPTIVGKVPTIGGNGFKGPYLGQKDTILAFFGCFFFMSGNFKKVLGQNIANRRLFCPNKVFFNKKNYQEGPYLDFCDLDVDMKISQNLILFIFI